MIQKIKHNRELFKNKRRLEKKLTMIRTEIANEQKKCEHIPAMLYYGEVYCILCGKGMHDVDNYINAMSNKTLEYTESYSAYLDNSMAYLQGEAMLIIKNNPNITEEELFNKLKETIEISEKEKRKIKE